MALSPLSKPEERAVRIAKKSKPSKTYSLDFDNGTIGGLIDGTGAVRQFIRKALATPRYRYLIYDGQYGCEMESLIAQTVPAPLLQSEIPRIIKEALIYDDRIKDVNSFQIRRENDALFVSFAVSTTAGIIHEEVTL
ncbi:hypothetical protein SK3146_03235 [Paenibacillus konkukensis]|uniref:DUF2634 domain-containing protein n=1 Tax=Paenibacillus konkukensis TaxID=2020716 RepID=A0ABY4RPD3_9BACL|nr:DUF2634 domain-containing protein [Paenibacillus konkukensis]UQZ84023.1 hypothetical protein SK3146_03235 [Paenibacillus konkukensis]